MASIAVLGAGAWGTAIACALAQRHHLTLWTREASQAHALAATRRNERYLPGIVLDAGIEITADLAAAVARAHHGLLVLAVPTAGLRETLHRMRGQPALPPIVWLCKGLERDSAKLAHEVVRDEMGSHPSGPLSGPSFAAEVARGLPTALTVAGSPEFCRWVTQIFHAGALRIYSTDDVVGVEIGGAVKNVMAIATGISDALGLGHNARAALITRGLAEIGRMGAALGARTETFMGLAGVGDLILTCTGELSRNRQVGMLLGRGVPLALALERIGHVAEGVWSAPAVAARAQAVGVEMPLTAAVCAVLDGRLTPRDALGQLLARDPKRE
ncbi:MAG: NAD(P)H-dependent glycerol-3-phosphate dehydrogenase [Gemmatimonadota bacterium]